jgi:hypothetical protein
LWSSVPSGNATQQMQHFVVRFGFISFITTGGGGEDATESQEDSGSDFHDQADAKWIVIRGPTPQKPMGHAEVGRP